MREPEKQDVHYGVFFETFYGSLGEAIAKAPNVIAAYRARS